MTVNESNDRSIPKPRRRVPVEVRLTLTYRFGRGKDDRVTVMDDRAIPMVGSLFAARDKIAKGFVTTLLQAVRKRPKVLRAIAPRLVRAPASKRTDSRRLT